MTANINVHAFTAQLVWPLCMAVLVTSQNLPRTDWFPKRCRNMVNAVMSPQTCFCICTPPAFLHIKDVLGLAFLLCQALPGLWMCYTTVPCRLRQGLKVSKLLGNQSSERSGIFLFSLGFGRWLLKNHKSTLKTRNSEVQLYRALVGIHVCVWTIYRYGKALLISELFRKEVPLGSPHLSPLFLKHHWVMLNLLLSWKIASQSSLKKEKCPWTVKPTIPSGLVSSCKFMT